MTHYWHWTRRITYTEGVRHIAQTAGAYWLIDAVASHQHDPKAKREEFQHWILEVRPDRTATLSMNDGNDPKKPLIVQQLEFCDYPEDRCELYLIQQPGGPGTVPLLLQPCEY